MSAVAVPCVKAFNMGAAVVRLLALAANKRAARATPVAGGKIAITPFRLHTIDDLPEPSSEWVAAHGALKAFADELAMIGGIDLMVRVYDAAVEERGYAAVSGVSASWDGCNGWWH